MRLFQEVDLLKELHSKVENGLLEGASNLEKESRVEWYSRTVEGEVKGLSLARLFSGSLLEGLPSPVSSQKDLFRVDWTFSQVEPENQKESVDLTSFKFAEVSKEGIDQFEFDYLWTKYNANFT